MKLKAVSHVHGLNVEPTEPNKDVEVRFHFNLAVGTTYLNADFGHGRKYRGRISAFFTQAGDLNYVNVVLAGSPTPGYNGGQNFVLVNKELGSGMQVILPETAGSGPLPYVYYGGQTEICKENGGYKIVVRRTPKQSPAFGYSNGEPESCPHIAFELTISGTNIAAFVTHLRDMIAKSEMPQIPVPASGTIGNGGYWDAVEKANWPILEIDQDLDEAVGIKLPSTLVAA